MRRKRQKQRECGKPWTKPSCVRAQLVEWDVRREAAERSLELVVNEVSCGKTRVTFHWMFNLIDARCRVLDYWPGNGKWWSRNNGERGVAKGPWEVLEVATKLAARITQTADQIRSRNAQPRHLVLVASWWPPASD
jgi:hypothetical protein